MPRALKVVTFSTRWTLTSVALTSVALTSVALTSMALTSVAQAGLVDRVVAFVDDEVILLSEVRERAEPELRAEPEGDRRAVVRRVLDGMIDHALVRREALRLGVVVTDAEVASAIEGLRRRNGLDEHEWRRALAAQGWTESLYAQMLRERLLHLKVMQQRTLRRVDAVTDDEVRAEWERRAAAFEGEPRYRVAELTRARTPDAPDAARVLQADLARLRAGAVTMAELGGTEIGWVVASELLDETRALLEGLEDGAFSEVLERPDSLTVLQRLERGETSIGSFESQAETIRAELVAERYQVASEEVLAELRSGAVIVRRF